MFNHEWTPMDTKPEGSPRVTQIAQIWGKFWGGRFACRRQSAESF